MKKVIKIFSTTLVFIGIFAISSLGTFTLLNNYDISSQKDLKTQFLTLKENMPRAYVVQSGSMEPAIMTGSLIFSLPQNNYRSGDVLTFEQGSTLVTHRAVYQEHTLDDSYFITKGDANKDVDNQRVSQSNVVGKVMFTLPYAGYLADFAKTPHGFILLVIVPATIVIYEELKSLMKELIKMIGSMRYFISRRIFSRSKSKASSNNPLSHSLDPKRRTNDGDDDDKFDLKHADKLIKGLAIIPIFGAVLVVSALSVGYFFDMEISSANIFSASSDFGISQHPFNGLVINEVLPVASCSIGNTQAQWIELYNGTDLTINPKDLMLTDGVNIIEVVNAGNLSMQPGEILLLAHNAAIWGTTPNSCWDDNGAQTGNLGGQLDINTGFLQLVDPQGDKQDISNNIVIDTVKWGEEYGLEPGVDQSIEREPKGKDSVFGEGFDENDFVVRENPTPGT